MIAPKDGSAAAHQGVRFFCGLNDLAIEAWNAGDIDRVMLFHGHQDRLDFVFHNLALLRDRGLYEKALYQAYIHGPYTTVSNWKFMFSLAETERFSQFTNALPDREIVLYRGLRDSTKRSFVRGLSWTASPGIAAWFATRYPQSPNYAPAVYRARVQPEQMIFSTNERSEQELVIKAWELGRIERLKVIPEPFKGSDAPLEYPFSLSAGVDEKEVLR